MNNGYEHASQYQLFLCAYPHGKRVMPLACERVKTCRVRVFTLFPEIPWRVTFYYHKNSLNMCVVGDLTKYTKFWRNTDVMKVLGKFSSF